VRKGQRDELMSGHEAVGGNIATFELMHQLIDSFLIRFCPLLLLGLYSLFEL